MYVGSPVECFDKLSVIGHGHTERRFEQIIGNSPALESMLQMSNELRQRIRQC